VVWGSYDVLDLDLDLQVVHMGERSNLVEG
jgi:hypothetical protein